MMVFYISCGTLCLYLSEQSSFYLEDSVELGASTVLADGDLESYFLPQLYILNAYGKIPCHFLRQH